MNNTILKTVKVLDERTIRIPEGATHYAGYIYSTPTFYKITKEDNKDIYWYWDRLTNSWYPYDSDLYGTNSIYPIRFVEQPSTSPSQTLDIGEI
jgi:hypothetical protein